MNQGKKSADRGDPRQFTPGQPPTRQAEQEMRNNPGGGEKFKAQAPERDEKIDRNPQDIEKDRGPRSERTANLGQKDAREHREAQKRAGAGQVR